MLKMRILFTVDLNARKDAEDLKPEDYETENTQDNIRDWLDLDKADPGFGS
jgi:hypothetical protein